LRAIESLKFPTKFQKYKRQVFYLTNGKEKKIEVPKKENKSKDIVLDDIVIDLKK